MTQRAEQVLEIVIGARQPRHVIGMKESRPIAAGDLQELFSPVTDGVADRGLEPLAEVLHPLRIAGLHFGGGAVVGVLQQVNGFLHATKHRR
nr:hypothetical protein [Halochromatium glycolicum]